MGCWPGLKGQLSLVLVLSRFVSLKRPFFQLVCRSIKNIACDFWNLSNLRFQSHGWVLAPVQTRTYGLTDQRQSRVCAPYTVDGAYTPFCDSSAWIRPAFSQPKRLVVAGFMPRLCPKYRLLFLFTFFQRMNFWSLPFFLTCVLPRLHRRNSSCVCVMVPKDPRVATIRTNWGLHHLDSLRGVDFQHGVPVRTTHGRSLVLFVTRLVVSKSFMFVDPLWKHGSPNSWSTGFMSMLGRTICVLRYV